MKSLTTSLLLLLLSIHGTAQFYFKTTLGYSIPQAGQTITTYGDGYSGSAAVLQNPNPDSPAIVRFGYHKASFSNGLNSTMGIGYMFDNTFGVEIDGYFGIASKKNICEFRDSAIVGPPYQKVTQYASLPVLLTPSLTIQRGNKNIHVYARCGVAIPIRTIVITEAYSTDLSGNYYTSKSVIKNHFSLGFVAALGAKYQVNSHLSLIGEANLLSMSLYIKEAAVTEATYNGIDKSYLYKNKTQYTLSTSGNTWTTRPTYSVPFSNFGISIGIIYSLK